MNLEPRGTPGTLGTLGTLLIALVTVGAGQSRPDLSGAWTLNPELTAQARQTEASREPNVGRRLPMGGGPVGMGGGGRGPVSGGYGGGGQRRDPEEMAKAREGMRLAMLIPQRLTIVGDSTMLTVTDNEGVSQKWTLNGKTSK